MDKRLGKRGLKGFLFLFGIIFLIGLVSASEFQYLTGENYMDDGSATSGKNGIRFVMNVNATLTAARMDAGSDVTKVYLLDSGKNILYQANSVTVGSHANFTNASINLVAGTTYYIAGDNNGATFARRYDSGWAGYPVSGVHVNWTGGLGDGADNAGNIFEFDGLWFQNATDNIMVEILSPPDNGLWNGNNLSVRYNITNTDNFDLQNITLNIYNSAGSNIGSSFIDLGDTTDSEVVGNVSSIFSGNGVIEYDLTLRYDGGMTTLVSNRQTVINALTINVVDESNLLIDDGVATVNGTYYNNNPIYFPIGSMSNPENENITINASSLGGNYISNYTSVVINVSQDSYYNVTLQSYKLLLSFTKGGSAFNVSGYITDLNYSYTFSNQTFLKNQDQLSDSIVYARFINGAYSVNLTWENKSQFYEYDNSVRYSISETIEIFNDIDTSSYFQTQDNSGNIIKGATLRLYSAIPTNSSGTNSSYAFYGQRITDNNGQTVFAMDSEAELYLTASATGYQTKTIRLTASEITTFTSDNPLPIRLEKSPYTQKDNIFVSDLWKVDGSRVYTSRFDDLSKDYFMFVYDYYLRDLKYSTSFEGVNRSISLDSTTRSGIMEFNSGEQFSNSNNATWYVYLYADDQLIYTIGVTYGASETEVILNIEDEGLDNNSTWKVVIFLGLIIMSSLVGLLFRTPEGDAGVHTFFIGGFLLSFMATAFGWLTLMGVFNYLGKMIKKWVSE